MLEKLNLPIEKIAVSLQREYGLNVNQVTFLPLGADLDTAVYRVESADKQPYFLKLRSGVFDPASVLYPKFLSDEGLAQIIAPIPIAAGRLWGTLGSFKTILYPFVEGQNGYELRLSDQHWQEFGATLKRMHEIDVPTAVTKHIQRETYSPQWRERLKATMALAESGESAGKDSFAQELVAFMKAKQDEILALVDRAEQLAQTLRAQPREFIVCHADLHAGNIFIDNDGTFYLVDWDTLRLAPKERDLMYIGGALMAGHRSPDEEEALFYSGYGETDLDPAALAYYRFERIIEDLAIYSGSLLLSEDGGEDREPSLRSFKSNFLPGHTLEMAYRVDY